MLSIKVNLLSLECLVSSYSMKYSLVKLLVGTKSKSDIGTFCLAGWRWAVFERQFNFHEDLPDPDQFIRFHKEYPSIIVTRTPSTKIQLRKSHFWLRRGLVFFFKRFVVNGYCLTVKGVKDLITY